MSRFLMYHRLIILGPCIDPSAVGLGIISPVRDGVAQHNRIEQIL